jgi:hypothetical protein
MNDSHKTHMSSFESFFNELFTKTIEFIMGLLFFKFYLNFYRLFGVLNF